MGASAMAKMVNIFLLPDVLVGEVGSKKKIHEDDKTAQWCHGHTATY
jgi:hypothetical protein